MRVTGRFLVSEHGVYKDFFLRYYFRVKMVVFVVVLNLPVELVRIILPTYFVIIGL
jgi:hypothetical protein